MLAVIKHAVDAIFFFQQPDTTVHMSACCVQHSSDAAVQNFTSWQLWSQQPKNELNWLQHKIYGVIWHHEYELQASNIE